MSSATILPAIRLKRRIDSTAAADNGRLERRLAERLDAGDGAMTDARLATFAGWVRNYVGAAPAMLELAAAWMERRGATSGFGPLLDNVQRYLRSADDEFDDQRHGLFDLLDDAYLVYRTIERMAEAGLPTTPGMALAHHNGIARTLLGNDLAARLEARLDAVMPEAAAPLDPRLFGVWNRTTFLTSDEFSYSNTRSRWLDAGGRYVEGSQSAVAMVHRDGGGQTSGHSGAHHVPADERGGWTSADGKLTIRTDSGEVYVFDYRVEGRDGLLLTQPGREAEYWRR